LRPGFGRKRCSNIAEVERQPVMLP